MVKKFALEASAKKNLTPEKPLAGFIIDQDVNTNEGHNVIHSAANKIILKS